MQREDSIYCSYYLCLNIMKYVVLRIVFGNVIY